MQKKHKKKISKVILGLMMTFILFFTVSTVAVFVSGNVGGEYALAQDTGANPEVAPEEEQSTWDKIWGSASSGIGQSLLLVYSSILDWGIQFLGWLISFLVAALQMIASYKGYADNEQIATGWKIVRDTVNSFFIIVLIAIAILTIIRVQKYHFKSTLPKLIIATFLVNFSKTITLLAISFSDAIMNTFSVAIKGAWPALVLGLRLPATIAANAHSIGDPYGTGTGTTTSITNALQAMGTQMVSLATLVIASSVILMIVIILLYRVIMLWILIILSPLAFFLWGAPGKAGEYWSTWLGKFIKEVIVGPVLMFFLYIDILFFVNNMKVTTADAESSSLMLYGFDATGLSGLKSPVGTLFSDASIVMGYIIGIALLYVTIEVANEIGARGTSMAMNARGKYMGGWKSAGRRYQAGLYRKMADGYVPFVPKALQTRLAESKLGKTAFGRAVRFVNPSRLLAGTVRPLATLQAMQEGLDEGAKENIRGGQASLAGHAEKVTKEGGVFGHIRGLAASFNAGGGKSWEKDGIMAPVNALIRDVRGMGNGNTEKVMNNMRGITERRKLGTSLGSIDKDTMKTVSHLSPKKLNSMLDVLDRGSPRDIRRYADKLSTKDRNAFEEIRADEDSFSSLNETVRDGGIGQSAQLDLENDTLGEIQGRMNAEESADNKEMTKLQAVMKDRKEQAKVYSATVRSGFDSKLNDHMKKSYDPEAYGSYSASEISSNALGHANKNDVPELGGDLIQAAKQGSKDLKLVLGELSSTAGKNFSLNSEGIGELQKWMTDPDGVGATPEEAARIIKRMEREISSSGTAGESNFIKRADHGGDEVIGKTERSSLLREKLGKMDIGNLLKSNTFESMVGTTDVTTGKLLVDDGFIQHLNSINDEQLAKVFEKTVEKMPPANLRVLKEYMDSGELQLGGAVKDFINKNVS